MVGDNMEEWINKQITPFTFYCQHVLPLVYDQSLSYYEVLCKLQYKLNEVIQTQNNLQDAFQNLLNWVNSQLEKYAKDQLNEWLNDGTLDKIIINILNPLLDTKKDKEQLNDNTQNNPLLTNELLECALTYYYNNDKLFYENDTALNDTIQVDSQGRKAIDCSTLVCLCLNGVKYETSRYQNGGDKYNNIKDYVWGVNIYDDGTPQFRRYANMMGKYFYDNGWSFLPNDTFSNLETGDLMFWKGDPVSGSFRDISHVAIFLTRTVDNKIFYLDANQRSVNVVNFASTTITPELKKTIILCGRFNFNGVNYTLPQNIVNGNNPHTINTTTGVTYSTLSSLQKGYYTVLLKGDGDNPSISSNGVSYTTTYIGNNLYIGYLRLNDISNNNVKIYVSNNQKTFNMEWVCVYRRYLSYPVPYYVRPTITGNRGKVTLKNQYTINQSPSTYVQIPFDNFVGNNFSNVLQRNGNFLQVLESGTYIINVAVFNRTNTFGNIRVSKFDINGENQKVLNEDNIQYMNGHSAYKKMTFGVLLQSGEQIGLLMTCDANMTLGNGSFGTYIEVIKI